MTGRKDIKSMRKNVGNENPFTGETEKQEMVVRMDENENFVADLTSRQTTFCSMTAETRKDKALLFKAMNNPEKRLGDCINMTINAKDLFCEVVRCINNDSGEISTCPRIVIIDDKGVAYQAVSIGVYNAVKKLINVFGLPTWKEPLPITVKQITKGDRKILTFDVM